MRYLFVSFLLLALAWPIPCQAGDEKAKPNTLTPKEIADGWILLFDGATTFGWAWQSPGNVKEKRNLKATDGALDLSELTTDNIRTTSKFQRFELRFEYKKNKGAASVNWNKQRGLSAVLLQKESQWTPVTLAVEDPLIVTTPITFTQFDGVNLQLRNIKLKPLNLRSLFNGNDLTGWKEFPGKKSKFAVIDHAINVKDGPGDLQTVGKYQDFILQLECISHGKHLNSGIFFRCRDNEYQNGYEAQIRNQFTPTATQEYTLEEYDPLTHKLLAKKKITATAVDYGTGAIYRRQPARKEMSKDNAWFGMTILAEGNHLATWVNGVQVTDWRDNRPLSDNARKGCKLGAGHLSIQGHDPTTDLSFRQLRIAELPAAK